VSFAAALPDPNHEKIAKLRAQAEKNRQIAKTVTQINSIVEDILNESPSIKEDILKEHPDLRSALEELHVTSSEAEESVPADSLKADAIQEKSKLGEQKKQKESPFSIYYTFVNTIAASSIVVFYPLFGTWAIWTIVFAVIVLLSFYPVLRKSH